MYKNVILIMFYYIIIIIWNMARLDAEALIFMIKSGKCQILVVTGTMDTLASAKMYLIH